MDILDKESGKLHLGGERFSAVYHLSGTREETRAAAEDICIEQTIEFPQDLVGRRDIRDQVFGRIENVEQLSANSHKVEISYALEIAGGELPQLLNVLFGNISLKSGVRLVDLSLPPELTGIYTGPHFGRDGLRRLLGVPVRPLLCTAIKPMGLSPGECADLAYRFALGGIDMIKDDHGLADQDFCPFAERVARCAEAVAGAEKETGKKCLYFPNVTAPADKIMERAYTAREAGAGGLMISPGLTGLDVLRLLAGHEKLGLPIFSHPALLGSFSLHPGTGIGHGVLYGQLNRLAGADACIFPNYGGRFPFSREDCRDLVDGTACHMGNLKPIFPIPAGGMTLGRVPELLEFYGNDVILLIGGDLFRHGPDISENCRKFAGLVQKATDA